MQSIIIIVIIVKVFYFFKIREHSLLGPGLDVQQGLERRAEPRVRDALDLRLKPQQQLPLYGTQQA